MSRVEVTAIDVQPIGAPPNGFGGDAWQASDHFARLARKFIQPE